MLRVVERALTAAGFTLAVAPSGEEALKLLARQEFACALIDRNLEGMDGLELIRHIRELQPRCACVLMTAYPSLDSAVEALRMGVVDYIEKPSPQFDQVGERVQKAIRIRQLRDEQGALLRRIGELESKQRSEGGCARLRVELTELLRDEQRRSEEVLLRGAKAIVAAVRALQPEPKSRGRSAFDRLLADAEAHAASLRPR